MSEDLYSYIGIGRVVSVYKSNPYFVPYGNFSFDPLFDLLKTDWSPFPVVYGPLFTLTISAWTYLGGNNLILNALIFKLAIVFLVLISSYLIYKITDSVHSLYLFAWNPYILLMTAGEVHNDMYWIALLLASLVLIRSKEFTQRFLGFVLLVLSVFFKFFSVILLPFWVLYLTKKKKIIKRATDTIFYVFLFFLVMLISYRAFWEGMDTFNMITMVNRIDTMMTSPFILVSRLLSRLVLGDFYEEATRVVGQVLFVFIYIRQYVEFYKKPEYIYLIKSSLVVLSAFVLTSLAWFMSWYLLSPMILLIVYMGVINNFQLKKFLYALITYAMLYGLVIN